LEEVLRTMDAYTLTEGKNAMDDDIMLGAKAMVGA